VHGDVPAVTKDDFVVVGGRRVVTHDALHVVVDAGSDVTDAADILAFLVAAIVVCDVTDAADILALLVAAIVVCGVIVTVAIITPHCCVRGRHRKAAR
jgi:hypothetical protein